MNSAAVSRFATRAVAALGVTILAACSSESPVSPVSSLSPNADITITPTTNGVGTSLILCKWATSSAQYDFTIVSSNPDATVGGQSITPTTPIGAAEYLPYTVAGCFTVLNGSTSGATITITETVPANTTLNVITGSGNATAFTADPTTTHSATITLAANQQATIIFKNAGTPPPPPSGCTYTQGYWKTHSTAGPAKKADATWLSATGSASGATVFLGVEGAGAFAPFGGKTWLGVFKTAPKGDARIILAHQFMAAYLNLHQSTPSVITDPAVQSAYNNALAYFKGTYVGTPDLLGWAATLDAFNNGLTGVPHCGQETVS